MTVCFVCVFCVVGYVIWVCSLIICVLGCWWCMFVCIVALMWVLFNSVVVIYCFCVYEVYCMFACWFVVFTLLDLFDRLLCWFLYLIGFVKFGFPLLNLFCCIVLLVVAYRFSCFPLLLVLCLAGVCFC